MALLHVGLDIGSTTAKAVVLDEKDRLIHSTYKRHYADIRATAGGMMNELRQNYGDAMITLAVAGSGAIAIAEGMHLTFAQELVACRASVERYLKGVDVSIELGGEDAKLTFFDESGIDQRMNETCAGGTGAFLDQMAALLGIDVAALNELAKDYRTIYPIASRCGVFAKTDVQPLLNDGAAREDIAASIFQAIVNQTISGLACGRKIKGNVAFLGGPLYFLSELRKRFAETLGLTDEQCVFPEYPHLFVALGEAILGKRGVVVDIAHLEDKARTYFAARRQAPVNVLPALFIDEAERERFRLRHAAAGALRADLAQYRGDAYLGIDVGSTTTKMILIGSRGEALFTRYRPTGGGEPIRAVRELLSEMYEEIPEGVTIKRSGVTGYGEKLVKAAFGIDIGEVETVAHSYAAGFFLPGVDFVIDIGGQDMKCLGMKDGAINKVFLNEACSSGCGSFLQSFAESLEMSVSDFAKAAETSMMPVDLGSRCTVFMNSRVRQAQKEGASVSDISAGLVYSVVRNALYKVLKIRSVDELGERIVVQGGAFKNDALLRAFELITGREVVRPELSELMGAFGAALLARDSGERGACALLGRDAVRDLTAVTSTERCGGCGNRCILTRTGFEDGRVYVSGNRCERGTGRVETVSRRQPPNLFERKYRRLFGFAEPLPAEAAPRGSIGIPRVLNMYEDYPFWFALFTDLGFRVELSSKRPSESLGIDTIPSQTVCYPAKLVHRHILDLLSRGVRRIFYPVIQRERMEFQDAHQNFNCPVIVGYPDVAYLNIDALRVPGVDFIRPAMSMASDGRGTAMRRRIYEELRRFGVKKSEVSRAFGRALEAQRAFRDDVKKYGDEALEYLKETGEIGIVLAGHPYHLDPEVHHGIPELINGYGVAVLTEDSICGRAAETGEPDALYVIDQWMYHSRLFRAATVIARHPDFTNVHMVQLNSFGCGLDAISADQAAAILERHGKPHTLIKIDEGKNNGPVNIRIRSLLSSVRMRAGKNRAPACPAPERSAPAASRSGEKTRTILCPPLSSHHFQFLEVAMRREGFDFRVLPEGGRESVELGLRYVNNDACYPAMVVVGQFLKALRGGEFDPETTDCFYAQTGGSCRASNYVPLLRRALDAAGFPRTRILAANAQGNGGAEKFTVKGGTLWRSMLGMLYGDLLMRLLYRTRPYELNSGVSGRLYGVWAEKCRLSVERGSWRRFKADVNAMVSDFAGIPIDPAPKPRVGIVGEILVKYHDKANEHLVGVIENEGGEAVVSDIANFLLYCLYDPVYARDKLSGPLLPKLFGTAGIGILERMRRPMRRALRGTRFGEPHDIRDMLEAVGDTVNPANQAGEGWLLSAEMMRLIEDGVKNIICIQPFACLPNHITGKGVMKELRRVYRGANILALDYDSSVSNVNQLNRIKLLMASAVA
jgi:predicted CoA-substrate-specific enzyme activase